MGATHSGLPATDRPLQPDDTLETKKYHSVLLAEDEYVNQRLIAAYLTTLDYSFHIVNNGLEALQALRSTRYDLVLLDLLMPVMGGIETISNIRDTHSDVLNHDINIIILTACIVNDPSEIIATGADHYLSKPVSINELKEVLDRWIPKSVAFSTDNGPESGCLNEQIQLDEEVITLFALKAPEYVSAIKTALAGGNYEDIQHHAHKLAGAAAAIRAEKLAGFAATMETIAINSDLPAAEYQQQQLEEALADLLIRLKNTKQTGQKRNYDSH